MKIYLKKSSKIASFDPEDATVTALHLVDLDNLAERYSIVNPVPVWSWHLVSIVHGNVHPGNQLGWQQHTGDFMQSWPYHQDFIHQQCRLFHNPKDSFHIFPAFLQACGWPRSRSRRPFFPLPAILDGRAQVDRRMPQVNQTMSYPTLSHEFTSAWLNFVTISTGLSNEYLHQQGIFQFPGHHLVPSEMCSTEPQARYKMNLSFQAEGH